MRNILFFFLFSLLSFTVAPAFSAGVTINDAELEEFIKRTIRENPKLIYDAVNQYVLEMRKARSQGKLTQTELDSLFDQRLEDAIREHNPIKGNENAPVTIIEYTDFECAYCKKGSDLLKELMEEFPDKIKIVFKNYPVSPRGKAELAARASMAARRQNKFWEFHDLLFHISPDFDRETILSYAGDLELDVEKFSLDMDSDLIGEWIRRDKEDAEKLFFTKTPGFLINGVMVSGLLPKNIFVSVIERLLEEAALESIEN